MTQLRTKKHIETVHEAVGVFDNAETLQNALDDLLGNGFMRADLSMLADDKAVEQKLGHHYTRVKDVEDDPAAPRIIFVPDETIGEAEATAFGLPLYLAVATTAGVVAASGGTMLTAILAATAAGAAGGGIGAALASFIAKHHADFIQKQVEHGGLLLWVHLRSPDLEETAKRILAKHSAHDVHIHEIPLYG